MRWPWSKREPTDCEGAAAHSEARAHLADVQAQWPEVKRVSNSLRELRERNHFAQQVSLIFQGVRRDER